MAGLHWHEPLLSVVCTSLHTLHMCFLTHLVVGLHCVCVVTLCCVQAEPQCQHPQCCIDLHGPAEGHAAAHLKEQHLKVG